MTAALLIPTAASAAPSDAKTSDRQLRELKAKQQQVRAKKAQTASQVDTLKATDAEINDALTALNANIAAQASQLEDARRAVAQAEAEKAAALAAEQQATNDLAALKTDIHDEAVKAYVDAPTASAIDLLTSKSLIDAAARKTLMQATTNQNLDSAERFRTVQQQLADARARSSQASEKADANRAAVESKLEALNQAQDQQEKFAEALDSRLDAALSEADALASIDTALASDISTKQSQLAAQLAADRAAAARRAKSVGGRVSSSSSGSGTVVIPSLPRSGGNGIVTVRGIRVDQSIAGALESMLAAAEADGVTMGGGGYRDPAGQLAVRRSNCGSSDYAIYQMPASSCHPPTARPGQSMHEQGLAIDFTQGGSTLNRGSNGYQWLRAHAGGYGFYNLPSEPWHWSTTGR